MKRYSENLSYRFIGAALLVFLSAACSKTKIENLSAFQQISVPEAQIMPTKEELAGKKARIAIFNIKNNTQIAERAKAGEAVTRRLYEYLSETNTELIQRSVANQYTDEIRLSQDSGAEYSGPKVADYVIDGSVDNTSFNVSYEAPYKAKSVITGKEYIVPAKCRYSAELAGSYSLFKLPNMELTTKISFSDQESYTEDAARAQSSFAEDIVRSLLSTPAPRQCPLKQGVVDKLLSDAAGESVRKGRIEIQNLFAPKGYVSEVLTYEDVYLIRVTVGSNSGLRQDQDVQIFTAITYANSLTGEESVEKRQIASGLVTNQIGSNYAYIIIPEAEEARSIKIGDFMKILFSKSGFEKFKDFSF